MDLTGQTLGQYRIIEKIGRGGMAEVYKAFQPRLERYVAVKVLPPYFAHDETFLERFAREAKAVASLRHPNILTIHDYGEQDEVTYLVMEYVEGGTLKQMVGQPLDIQWTAEIIGRVGSALAYAHRRGVIHRDVKPANILMQEEDWPLLSDFGLAKMVEQSVQLTKTGVGVGTPEYMSPEQGQGLKIDERTDVYSLGVVLYEMVTGQKPFQADTPIAVVLRHVSAPLTLPRRINPDVPESIELVILKAMAKSPADRFQRMGEMVRALEEVAAEITVAARAAERRARAEERKKLEGFYRQATAAQQAGQWAEAIGLFEEILSLRPGYRDAKARLSAAQRALEEEKERREREEKLAALYGQAEEALGAREWNKATELLEEVLALDASYRDAASRLSTAREEIQREEKERRLAEWYEQGLGCFEQKRWTEAIEHFRAIVDAEPGYRDAQQLLTRARWEMSAEEEERRLNALYERGVVNLEKGRWSQAIIVFEKVLAQRPDHAEAAARLEEARQGQELASLYDQAQKALKEKRWSAAVEALDKIVGLEAGYRDSQALLVQARERLAEAEEQERRARQQAELYDQGLGHLEAQEWSQAVACFEELERLEPGYRDVVQRLGTARAEIEQLAKEERRRAEAEALYRQGQEAVEAQRWTEAIETFEQAVALVPAYEDAEALLAEAKAERARLEEEVERVEKARAEVSVLPAEMVKPVALVEEEEVAPFWQRVPVWGWGAVGGVLLIAVGTVFLGGRGGKPTPAPVAVSVPTATAVPTVTPVPVVVSTAIPSPTDTPNPPTPTPVVPTETPTPVPTDTPTPTTISTETPTETSTVTPAPSLTSTSTPTAEPTISPELLDQIRQILSDWEPGLQGVSRPPSQVQEAITVHRDDKEKPGWWFEPMDKGIGSIKKVVYTDGKVEYYEIPWDYIHGGYLRFEIWPDGTKYEHKYRFVDRGWQLGEEKVIDITDQNIPKIIRVITVRSWYKADPHNVRVEVAEERNLETGETAILYFAEDVENHYVLDQLRVYKKKTDKAYEWFDNEGYSTKVTSDEEGHDDIGVSRLIRNQAGEVVGREYKDLLTDRMEYYEVNPQGELFLRFVFDDERGLEEYNEEGVVILTIPSTEMPTSKPVAVVETEALNVRSGPGTVYDIVAQARRSDTLTISGKNASGDWLEVVTSEGREGWVAASLVRVNVSLEEVAVVEEIPPTPTPTPIPVVIAPDGSVPLTGWRKVGNISEFYEEEGGIVFRSKKGVDYGDGVELYIGEESFAGKKIIVRWQIIEGDPPRAGGYVAFTLVSKTGRIRLYGDSITRGIQTFNPNHSEKREDEVGIHGTMANPDLTKVNKIIIHSGEFDGKIKITEVRVVDV